MAMSETANRLEDVEKQVDADGAALRGRLDALEERGGVRSVEFGGDPAW